MAQPEITFLRKTLKTLDLMYIATDRCRRFDTSKSGPSGRRTCNEALRFELLQVVVEVFPVEPAPFRPGQLPHQGAGAPCLGTDRPGDEFTTVRNLFAGSFSKSYESFATSCGCVGVLPFRHGTLITIHFNNGFGSGKACRSSSRRPNTFSSAQLTCHSI
jgi:hypothetical protein